MPAGTRECPSCHQSQYECLAESFGSTGWLHSSVQWRHEDSQRIGCAVNPQGEGR